MSFILFVLITQRNIFVEKKLIRTIVIVFRFLFQIIPFFINYAEFDGSSYKRFLFKWLKRTFEIRACSRGNEEERIYHILLVPFFLKIFVHLKYTNFQIFTQPHFNQHIKCYYYFLVIFL